MRSIFTVAACVICIAGESEKPQCNSRRQGELWPRVANVDSALRAKLNHCGQLEMCSFRVWRYRWMPVSVNVSQLGKTPQPVSPECQAVMDEAVRNTTASAILREK